MMTKQDIQTIFDSRLKALLSTGNPPLGGLPVAWGNMPRPRSDGGEWLRANLFIYTSLEEGIGSGRPIIRRGAYVIGIFVPADIGDGLSNRIQAVLERNFSGKTLSGGTGKLKAGAANPNYVTGEEGSWHHTNLDVPFITLR